MSCNELQAKVIAVVEMVISILMLILFGFFAVVLYTKKDVLIGVMEKYPDEHPRFTRIMQASTVEQISIFLIPIAYFTVEFGLGLFLFRSADRLQYKRLRLWSTVTITLVIVGLFFFVVEILRNQDFADIVVMFVLNLAFTTYSIWAVHCLMQEIKAGGVHHPVPCHHNYEYDPNSAFYKL